MSTVERPPLSQIIIYALGQLGWSVAAFGAGNLLVYFYMPPETGAEPIFPPFIYQGALFGVVTIIGLASFGGRLFDSITDPLLAGFADRSRSKFGKRKIWMAWSALPFAFLSFLIFVPLQSGSEWLNGTWLFVCLFLFYAFMTAYVIPYTALIGELGHHPDDRMKISTIISITWAVGYVIGSNAYAVQALLEPAYGSVRAFQMALLGFAVLALIFMWIPVWWLDENRYSKQMPVQLGARHSILKVINNLNFRYFAVADWLFWISITFIQLGVSYYITLLLGMDKSYASGFLTVAFLVSFALYYPVNVFVNRFGKKRVMLWGFIIFSLAYLITANLDVIPLPPVLLIYLLASLSAIPMAIFGIIPNAIIADLIYEEEKKDGHQLSGMFYAARNLTSKLGIAFANLLFPSLLLLGKSLDNPFGVRISAWIALGFCLIGYLVFLRYRRGGDL
jgi:Na+/melibiose symporter-like transporter